MKSEYVSLSIGTSEAAWLSRLLHELGVANATHSTLPLLHTSVQVDANMKLALPVHCDNQSAIKLA
jgi:hypothetical protein